MTCEIKLLGTSFTIKTDEDPEYMKQVMWYFKKKLQETQNNANIDDPLKLSILTSFTIIDELIKIRETKHGQQAGKHSKIEADIDDITHRLIDEIDQALTD
ncbi:MAG: cell division protein ZapA [Spirochaetaceae bacterium]|jgi:cell division protein ZapA (FtsZ GTPase activity inhibitor)|nr:cell division protein ZapA [Spirochaetaceae bacterium]